MKGWVRRADCSFEVYGDCMYTERVFRCGFFVSWEKQ
jgi:hypothetical protein